MTETSIARVPKRPIRLRQAWGALNQMFASQQLDDAFRLIEAMGGDDHPTFQRFLDARDGPRLLRERPSLVERLADRASLAQLPEASLGRAYAAFAERNGIAAEAIVAANHESFGDEEAIDPVHQWFFDRLNAMHDLWHVLTDYGTDTTGELLLVAFSRSAGIANRGLMLIAHAAPWRSPAGERRALRIAMHEAAQRGAKARHLIGAPFEELLERPLGDARIRLGIAPLEVAHPHGVPSLTGPVGRVAERAA